MVAKSVQKVAESTGASLTNSVGFLLLDSVSQPLETARAVVTRRARASR